MVASFAHLGALRPVILALGSALLACFGAGPALCGAVIHIRCQASPGNEPNANSGNGGGQYFTTVRYHD
jgi:hypothetical protein